ncbi:DEAD/DEAH box helicase [Rhodococcus sp. NPDC003318]|uniref:DEAD/DEAH box helicase n=1 Tax=Rhodococcus sp. NPDC003318 TaxID=3364503 RepID=UPI0036CB35AD
MPTFADLGLPATLAQSLRREKITEPFPIQALVIPDILAGRDLLGRGPTGSGKTLAFGLPMLVRLTGRASAPRRPRGLVLAPTRELGAQIERALDESALALGLRMAVATGGVPTKRQAERLARGVDLLVATPGRLIDLLDQAAVSLDDVLVTAVDEADHLADIGFLPQVTDILDRTPKGGQRLLFSATLDEDVQALVDRYLHDPVVHATASAAAPVAPADHHVLFVDRADKAAVVAQIAAREGRTLLFVRTQHGVDRLVAQLAQVGVRAGTLHGGKSQAFRGHALSAFTSGRVPVLVATDVAARGIHVDDVSLVVHVDPPADPKDYLHRAGRTARAGASGTVVTLVTDEQRDEVAAMLTRAGIDPEGVLVGPGDRALAAVTGARPPAGVPVADDGPPRPAERTANRPGRTPGRGGRVRTNDPGRSRGQRRRGGAS